MKDEGMPFNKVPDRIFETKKVISIPNIITPVSITVDKTEFNMVILLPMKNMVIMEIRSGNLPLHGTKLLVRIAIRRSLGESIILHPMIPQALHPNPIHIVKDCFP